MTVINNVSIALVAADWDQFTEGDTDDDGGHIVDDYGMEEMPAVVSDAQLVSDSYADWLAEARPSREVPFPAQLIVLKH